jgi:hypothetical protein
LYGRHIAPRSQHLQDRLEDIEANAFDAEINDLKGLGKDALVERYKARDIEPK